MGSLIEAGVDTDAFLRRAMADGYAMQTPFVHPSVAGDISRELKENGYLIDYTELRRTSNFASRGMHVAAMLHRTLNEKIVKVTGIDGNHLPLFSVRVFQPGRHGTTIHRNADVVGPWALGVTLNGIAPFNVYGQNQLGNYQTIDLVGDGSDPKPKASMEASAGAGWILYTKHELVPHSSGIVESDVQRELLIMYGEQYD